jgi:hypothetical protein
MAGAVPGVRTSAGSTISITATKPATFDAAGYGALAPTIIGEITNLGDFGREYEEVKHERLSDRSTQKFKGGFDEGTMTLQLGLDESDAGQVLASAALLSDLDYYFKVVRQNGTIHYFPAKVMSFKRSLGARNQVTAGTIALSISTGPAGEGVITVFPA